MKTPKVVKEKKNRNLMGAFDYFNSVFKFLSELIINKAAIRC